MGYERGERPGLVARLGMVSEDAPPWTLGEALLAPTILLVSTILIGTVVTASLTGGSLNPPTAALLVGWMTGLVLAAVFIAVRWRSTPQRFAALRLERGTWPPLLALLIGISIAFAADLIAGLGSGSFNPSAPLIGLERGDIGQGVLAVLLLVIAAPIAESLALGGVLLPRLRASLGAWPGLLTTAGLYALYAYLLYGTRLAPQISVWYGLFAPLLIGLGLCAVRVWSGSTRTMIVTQIGVGLSMLAVWLIV